MDYMKQKGYIGCMDHMDCMMDYTVYKILKSRSPLVFETCYHFH